MHIIAYFYHWDRETLYNLSFNERRMWAKTIIDFEEMKAKEVEKNSK